MADEPEDDDVDDTFIEDIDDRMLAAELVLDTLIGALTASGAIESAALTAQLRSHPMYDFLLKERRGAMKLVRARIARIDRR